MEKNFEVSEQNFTEGKAVHFLRSVMQYAKLSYMIKNFKKMKRSNGIVLFEFSIEKVQKII